MRFGVVVIINLFHSQTMWLVDQRVNDAGLGANCNQSEIHAPTFPTTPKLLVLVAMKGSMVPREKKIVERYKKVATLTLVYGMITLPVAVNL